MDAFLMDSPSPDIKCIEFTEEQKQRMAAALMQAAEDIANEHAVVLLDSDEEESNADKGEDYSSAVADAVHIVAHSPCPYELEGDRETTDIMESIELDDDECELVDGGQSNTKSDLEVVLTMVTGEQDSPPHPVLFQTSAMLTAEHDMTSHSEADDTILIDDQDEQPNNEQERGDLPLFVDEDIQVSPVQESDVSIIIDDQDAHYNHEQEVSELAVLPDDDVQIGSGPSPEATILIDDLDMKPSRELNEVQLPVLESDARLYATQPPETTESRILIDDHDMNTKHKQEELDLGVFTGEDVKLGLSHMSVATVSNDSHDVEGEFEREHANINFHDSQPTVPKSVVTMMAFDSANEEYGDILLDHLHAQFGSAQGSPNIMYADEQDMRHHQLQHDSLGRIDSIVFEDQDFRSKTEQVQMPTVVIDDQDDHCSPRQRHGNAAVVDDPSDSNDLLMEMPSFGGDENSEAESEQNGEESSMFVEFDYSARSLGKFIQPYCPVCNLICSSFPKWSAHLCEEHGFSNVETLGVRIIINRYGTRGFQCSYPGCGKNFARRNRYTELLEHQIGCHLPFPDYMQCRLCKIRVSTRAMIYSHVLCEHRNLLTGFKKQIESQIQYFNYNCPVCNAQFITNKQWREHLQRDHDYFNLLKTRTDKDGYDRLKCLTCEHTMRSRDAFIHALRHERYHAFECQLCEFSTSLRSTIMAHYRRKHKQQPSLYECVYCSQVFNCARLRSKHLRSVHPHLMLSCEVCKRMFCRPALMLSHILTSGHKQSSN